MKDFFKYLTAGEEDTHWGIYLNVAGSSHVKPNSKYPSPKHPTSYYFNWESGRILHEFQINYITNGEGILETEQGKFKITQGSVLLLFPGVWHRYKPDPKTGWTEHYIGFNGDFTDKLYQHELLSRQNPVLRVGFQEQLLREFNEVFQMVEDEKPGFQQECSGKLIYILARIISIIKNSEFAGKEIERKIRMACLYLRDNVKSNVNVEELASELNVGYSYFRRMFKKYTGSSPAQYHMNLRIQKAREMLITGEKSIKEIAFALGFESNQYFSRIFDEKCGMSPLKYRKSQTQVH
jgi:AraC-like DNA-binding protein